MTFQIQISAFENNATIPERFAFGKPGEDSPFAISDNISPAISWSGAPSAAKSFAICLVDPDVPSVGDDVNQADRSVSKDLPRVEFFHWVLADIPASVTALPEGAGSSSVVPRGKPLGQTKWGITGRNSYTDWFAGDADMEGVYAGYDGPCPPWNDELVHRYHFEIFALDVESLGLSGDFDALAMRAAMEGHVLAKATHTGTYTMNKNLR